MDFTGRRHTQITILPYTYVMPTPDTGCEVAGPCQEHRHSRQDWSAIMPNIADIISKRRQALFGHAVRLDATTPAPLHLHTKRYVRSLQWKAGRVWGQTGEDLLGVLEKPGYSRSATEHWPAGDRCGRVQMNVDIVGSRRNGPQLSTRHDDDDGGMEGWVDLGGWLHTEMVYLLAGSHPSQY